MRFKGNCENFVRNSKTVNLDDPIYVRCNELELAEKEIAEIRKTRFDYIAINEKLQIVVIDQIKFDENIAKEKTVMDSLSKLILMFNQLNPLFEKITSDLPRITEPTLTGLKRLRSDYRSQNAGIVSRIKAEAAARLTTRGFKAGSASIQEILESPGFEAYQAPLEKQIAENDKIIEKINTYISEVESIINNIYGGI